MISKNIKSRLKIIEGKLQNHTFPPQIVIENTSYCNQRCIHCSHRELIRPKRHMNRGLWDKIVEEISRVSPQTEIWPTFYGEALIMGKNDELWGRIDYADRVGCRNLVLNSNGMLLDRWDNMDRILTSPLKRFILSLDGFSKEVYEKIRVGGKRDKVYAQVEQLLRLKQERNQLYPVIICQFSEMDENRHEIPQYSHYWKSHGAEIKVRPKLEWTATGTVRSSFIVHDTGFRIACPWGNNTMAIHQDGRVVTCAVDYEGMHTVGNINNISVQEAWDRLDEQVRKVHRERRWEDLPEICKGCGDWQTAGASYEEESIEGTRPFWWYDD